MRCKVKREILRCQLCGKIIPISRNWRRDVQDHWFAANNDIEKKYISAGGIKDKYFDRLKLAEMSTIKKGDKVILTNIAKLECEGQNWIDAEMVPVKLGDMFTVRKCFIQREGVPWITTTKDLQFRHPGEKFEKIV